MTKQIALAAILTVVLAPLQGLAHELSVDADESVALIVPAKGVQIYECRNKEWAFVAPAADLFDANGKKIGRHYEGPQWEAADGSRIAGTVKARADAPARDAIPWLLLSARSVGGKGAFSGVSSVRRVNTLGGVAPHAHCSGAEAGNLVRVPYTADYYFFTRN
jgi:hypothetical protein